MVESNIDKANKEIEEIEILLERKRKERD